MDQKYFCSLGETINPTEKTKIIHYTLVLWGEMNGRLGRVKINLLRVILDSGASSSVRICKHTQKWRNKNIKKVRLSTQGDYFNANNTIRAEILQYEIYATKSVRCSFHTNDYKIRHRHDMILVCNILSKINIYF